MNIFSRVAICACAGALIAGCGSAPYRSGKGNDHQVMYRPHGVEEQRVVESREVVYVREPYVRESRVYYEPVPSYGVVTADPAYSTVTTRPAYRYVPVTRHYYYD
jgi:hypothetical protein